MIYFIYFQALAKIFDLRPILGPKLGTHQREKFIVLWVLPKETCDNYNGN